MDKATIDALVLVLMSVLGFVFSTAGSVFAASLVFKGNIRLNVSSMTVTVALSSAASLVMLWLFNEESLEGTPYVYVPSIIGACLFIAIPMICTYFYFEKSERKMPTESFYVSFVFGLVARGFLFFIEGISFFLVRGDKFMTFFLDNGIANDIEAITDIFFDVKCFAIVSFVLMILCLISFLVRFKKTQGPLRVSKLGKRLYWRVVFFCVSAVMTCAVFILFSADGSNIDDPNKKDTNATTSVFSYEIKAVTETALVLITTASLVVLVIYALHSYIDAKLNEEHANKLLDTHLEHYSELEKRQQELRRIRHDFKGNLNTIARYINSGNTPDALNYIYSLGVRLDNTRTPYVTGNSLLDGILASKKTKFDEKGIALSFKGVFPDKGIDNLDICNIFENALNNAYESCIKLSTDAFTSITCQMTDDRVWVKIKNPTNHTEKIHDGIVKTTKKDESLHGLGMISMQKAVRKYGGEIKTYYEAEKYKNQRFVIVFDLKYKNESAED